MTAVTVVVMPGQEIWFGVLTLLGSCMLLGALLEKLLVWVPPGWDWSSAVCFCPDTECESRDSWGSKACG